MNKSNSISDERLRLHSLYYPSRDLDGLFEAASGYLKELEEYKKQQEDEVLIKLPHLHHYKNPNSDYECWQVTYIYRGVIITTECMYDEEQALEEFERIKQIKG